METRVIEQKENKLVGRKEIVFEIVYEKTPPKRTEAHQSVSSSAKVIPSVSADFLVSKRKILQLPSQCSL